MLPLNCFAVEREVHRPRRLGNSVYLARLREPSDVWSMCSPEHAADHADVCRVGEEAERPPTLRLWRMGRACKATIECWRLKSRFHSQNQYAIKIGSIFAYSAPDMSGMQQSTLYFRSVKQYVRRCSHFGCNETVVTLRAFIFCILYFVFYYALHIFST